MGLACQKAAFSLDESVHYINCAYMAPLLKSAEEAGYQGLLRKRNPQRVAGSDFFTQVEELRGAIAQLIKAKSASQIALIHAASYGLSNAAKNVNVRAGQDVILVKDEFPSNFYTWQRLCKEKGLNLKVISPDADASDRTANWNAKIIDAITANTAVVALEHTHWMDGTLFDLKAISDKIQGTDAYFIVDGTQSVGMLPINVADLKLDALVCAGYKWMLGPYSSGFAYYSERLSAVGIPIEENWIIRDKSNDFANLTNYTDNYRDGAMRFDAGETSNFINVPILLTAVRQILDWQPERMNAYVKAIAAPTIATLQDRKLLSEAPNSFNSHLFSAKLPAGVNVQELSERFAAKKVYTSVRGNFLRISPNVYNTDDDLAVLCELLLR